jgi:hypothetical protein
MKLTLVHPLREWWLRLKLPRSASPPCVARKQPLPLTRPKAHRTTSFFELP